MFVSELKSLLVWWGWPRMSPYNVLDAVLCYSSSFLLLLYGLPDQTEADLAVESDREC